MPAILSPCGICVRLRQRPAPPALRWPHWKFGVCRILLPVSRRLGLARICSVRSAPKHAPTDTLSCLASDVYADGEFEHHGGLFPATSVGCGARLGLLELREPHL